MNSIRPKALIIGHSFVRRLNSDLERNFDPRADIHFGLDQSMDVFLQDIGGLTVSQLRGRCSRPVRDVSPDILLLEIGTNDLGNIPPEIVGSNIYDLVEFAHSTLGVPMVGVSLVIPHRLHESGLPDSAFNSLAEKLNHYLSVVLDDMPFVFVWRHKELESLHRAVLLPDGVHLNQHGQYLLYWSCRVHF